MMNQVVLKTLRDIRTSNDDGLLTAEDVVVAAKKNDSPLHKFFVWNDTEAAHRYRIQQARDLISSIEYVIDERTESTAPVFYSLMSDRTRDGGGYREIATIMSDDDLQAELLNTAIAELDAFRRRYQRIAGFRKLFNEIEKLRDGPNRKGGKRK